MNKIEIDGIIKTPRGDIHFTGEMLLEKHDDQLIKEQAKILMDGFMEDLKNYNFDKGEPDCQREVRVSPLSKFRNKVPQCMHCGEVIN